VIIECKCHIVQCDACGCRDNSDWEPHYSTPAEAISSVQENADWAEREGRLICRRCYLAEAAKRTDD